MASAAASASSSRLASTSLQGTFLTTTSTRIGLLYDDVYLQSGAGGGPNRRYWTVNGADGSTVRPVPGRVAERHSPKTPCRPTISDYDTARKDPNDRRTAISQSKPWLDRAGWVQIFEDANLHQEAFAVQLKRIKLKDKKLFSAGPKASSDRCLGDDDAQHIVLEDFSVVDCMSLIEVAGHMEE